MKRRVATPLLLALALSLLPPGAAPAQEPSETAAPRALRPDAFVLRTGVFSFFNDPRLNLHDFLIWRLASDEPVVPRPDCLAGLAGGRTEAFRRAESFYRERLARGAPDSRGVVLDLRFHLVGHPDVEIADDPATVEEAVRHLNEALPAYRACWWAQHEARNRRWIDEVVPLVVAHEEEIAARLSRLYRVELETPHPVDVVGYASAQGANTIVDPNHTLITGVEEAFRGPIRLEILFHEASHTLMDPHDRPVAQALWRAARAQGRARPPDGLWHAVLFFTTGRTVERVLAGAGAEGFRQFLYGQGLFERAWPDFRVPIEAYWRPYVDGEAGLDEAATRLIRAVGEDAGPPTG